MGEEAGEHEITLGCGYDSASPTREGIAASCPCGWQGWLDDGGRVIDLLASHDQAAP